MTTTTSSEASRYQQLRDHLNYLRLPDAAAALPAVLDQAKAEKLSMTAALETCCASNSRPPKPAG